MTAAPFVEMVDRLGWPLVRLGSGDLDVHCLPGRGCDVLSVRPWDGPELLFATPWGLRRRGAATGGGDDRTLLMEQYPGGWQTVFPNAGPAREAYGAPWGMHGEAWLAPFEVIGTGVTADGAWLEAETRLVRSPFRLRKRVAVDGASVTVTETVTNEGGQPVEVMWGQHPAFSAALLGPRAELSTSATRVVVDPDRDTPTTDLQPGAVSVWPYATGRGGGAPVDLRPVPPASTTVDRLLYLTGFPDAGAWVRLADPDAGLAVALHWERTEMPHAWYWLESHATPDFPWYAGVRAFALEPATSWPAARDAGPPTVGGAVPVAAGERRTHRVRLQVEHLVPTAAGAPTQAAPDER